jgi:hypothetical protein
MRMCVLFLILRCAFRNGKPLTAQMLAEALDDDQDNNHELSTGWKDDAWHKVRTLLLK